MEQIINLILVIAFLVYLWYEKHENKEETKVLIRELTTSITSHDVEKYNENLPQYKEIKDFVKEPDEIIPLDEVDPELLLKSIKNV